jgi:hypothetical protein
MAPTFSGDRADDLYNVIFDRGLCVGVLTAKPAFRHGAVSILGGGRFG